MKAIPPLLAAALLLTGSGCKERPGGSNSATAPADYLNDSVKAEKHAFKKIDVTAVNKAIESYYVQEGRFPKDLMELVEKSYLAQIPELPDGATWVYDTNVGLAQIKK